MTKTLFLNFPYKGRTKEAIEETYENAKRILQAYFPNDDIIVVTCEPDTGNAKLDAAERISAAAQCDEIVLTDWCWDFSETRCVKEFANFTETVEINLPLQVIAPDNKALTNIVMRINIPESCEGC